MTYPRGILALHDPRGRAAAWAGFAAIVAIAISWSGLSPWLLRFVLLAASVVVAGALLGVRVRMRPRIGLAEVLSIAGAAALLGGLSAAWLVWALERMTGRHPQSFPFDALCGIAFAGAMIAGPLCMRIASERRREQEEARHREELAREQAGRERAQMELAALQAQIEPHFLYNTLANVQHLVRSSPERADGMLGSLIDYLRSSLPRIRGGASTVGEEIARVEAYLAIMRVRMGSRLEYEVAVPEALLARPLPPLTLMTLVENAVKHGLEPLPAGGTIRIEGSDGAGAWHLRVADDGRGFGAETSGGIGLDNLRRRLRSLHGDRARLELSPRDPAGVEASVCLPHP